jgi:hypothetical protein
MITISNRFHGLLNGYRSGLEEKCAEQIRDAGLEVHYEEEKLDYEWPSRKSKYCPDFKIPTKSGHFFIESKGRFTVADRQKHLLIKEQHPDIEVRFVFSNQNAKLYRGSPTSYAQWAEKHGFKYAHKRIPDEWLTEGENEYEPE